MKVTTKGIALIALAAGILWAQETRKEVVNAAHDPRDDAKTNSEAVPDVYAIQGHFDRIVVLRFKFDTDLLAGMEKIVREQKIENAVNSSGIESDLPLKEHVCKKSYGAGRPDWYERIYHQRQDSRAYDAGQSGQGVWRPP
jgi:hypothetical protein